MKHSFNKAVAEKILSSFALIIAVSLLNGCGDETRVQEKKGTDKDKITAYVSIVPQADFVERIAQDKVDVHIMVQPGHSPATYEPSPRQMGVLEESDVYFRIGVPFEQSWMKRIRKVNPGMKVIDTAKGITFREITENTEELTEEEAESAENAGHDSHEHAENQHDHKGKDPHIWLNPKLVKIQAENITQALQQSDPDNSDFYEANLEEFHRELTELDEYIRQQLSDLKNRNLHVFHPAWGYFADAYDLRQVAIEQSGKEPGAKQLGELIDAADKEEIKAIFVQKEFSQTVAKSVAETVGAEVVTLDPLARNYVKNMKSMADIIAEKVNQ